MKHRPVEFLNTKHRLISLDLLDQERSVDVEAVGWQLAGWFDLTSSRALRGAHSSSVSGTFKSSERTYTGIEQVSWRRTWFLAALLVTHLGPIIEHVRVLDIAKLPAHNLLNSV